MSEIKPALTAEEWERVEVTGTSVGLRVPGDYKLPEDVDEAFEILVQLGDNTHRTAALCLHGQPFGFTRGDVLFLREIGLDHEARRYVNTEEAEDLADCIEALLPPEAG